MELARDQFIQAQGGSKDFRGKVFMTQPKSDEGCLCCLSILLESAHKACQAVASVDRESLRML